MLKFLKTSCRKKENTRYCTPFIISTRKCFLYNIDSVGVEKIVDQKLINCSGSYLLNTILLPHKLKKIMFLILCINIFND